MTYVMSDIHGEINRWKAILEMIQFSDSDTLYILGDCMDRFPHGVEVMLDIMTRPNVNYILGNHDQMCLDTFWSTNDYDARRLWTYNGGGNTYKKMVYGIPIEVRLRILRFIQESPDHLEITVGSRDFYLVHGNVGQTKYDRIWGRPEPPPTEPPVPGKTVIVGHTCTYYLNILDGKCDDKNPFKIFHAPGFIAIDCGCGNYTDLRRLACLRLDDMKEFYI